ncbi:MAG: hypothetical protein JNK87_20360 [Bryobacterales bacterium]|nr:hypothetical protein [Bryobacterales bacterium]
MDAWCAADRAVEREIGRLSVEWRRRVWGLRTIAAVAPWMGILLTGLEWQTAFGGGFGADRFTIMTATVGRLGDVFTFIPLGLGTGLLAVWTEATIQGMAADRKASARKGWAELSLLTR